MVDFFSKSISKRGFVQKELKIAMDILDEFPENEIFIIPVRIEDCKINNEKLAKIQWIDLFSSYEKGLKDIIKVILSIKSIENKNCEDDKQSNFIPDNLNHVKQIVIGNKNIFSVTGNININKSK